jgi:hypothetical protein
LPKLSPRAHAACIYKDKLVYIFGGKDLSGKLAACEFVNIQTEKFGRIADLPQKSFCNIAAEFNSKIYLCGYDMDNVLYFDGISYTKDLPVAAKKHKILCSGWILTESKLYEMTSDHFSQYPFSFNSYIITRLNSYCTFKRKNYIYFIHSKKRLARINLNFKTVEEVRYYI